MARHFTALAVLAALAGLSGCVAREKYDALKLEKDALVEQLGQAQAEASAAKAAEQAWKNQIDALMTGNRDAQELARKLGEENASLKAQLASMDEKYRQALSREPIVNLLSPELKSALEKFAQENPDLVEFDPARGIVKFKSDVTFAKGSAELTPQAKQAIARFAQIVNSPAARDYELMVAGHTDNTPVSNPETIRKGHHNNWYLSAHRAIAVGSELMSHGTSPRRLGVAGYADQRPVASNATSEGQARNRRVEVVLLPTTYRGGPQVAGSETPSTPPARRAAPAPAPVRRADDLNKDTVMTDHRPILNK